VAKTKAKKSTTPRKKKGKSIVVKIAVLIVVTLFILFMVLGLVLPYLGPRVPSAPAVSETTTAPEATEEVSPVEVLETMIKDLEQKVEEDPDNLELLERLGNLYSLAGRWDEAIRTYLRILELNPDNNDVRTNLGTAYFYQGEVEKAIEIYLEVLERDPGFEGAVFNLAFVYDATGNYDKAIEYYEKFLAMTQDERAREFVEKRIEEIKQKKGER
jgi:cytochrome c-type biogenesis protein CcmH/NrfG